MSAPYKQRQLYGGAVVVNLPADFLDASDLRQIPDHQEVFLSPTTLTSIIFEINEYQTTSAVEVHSNIRRVRSNDSSHNLEEDEAASTHHFLDPVVPPDTIDPGSITRNPPRISLSDASLGHFPAYTQSGTVITGSAPAHRTSTGTNISGEPQQHQQGRSFADQSSSQQYRFPTTTRVYQLLVRLKKYDTDLCIRVNVPLEELRSRHDSNAIVETRAAVAAVAATNSTTRAWNHESEDEHEDGHEDGHGEWKIANELGFAETALEEIIQSLQVVDFNLFTAE